MASSGPGRGSRPRAAVRDAKREKQPTGTGSIRDLENFGGPTPEQLGFRMPAEWESHAATWIAWPHNRSDWPGKYPAIPWVYGEIVRRLAASDRVRILADSDLIVNHAQQILRQVGANLSRVEFIRCATDRSWTRDYGPIFVQRQNAQRKPETAIVHFRFNAWARYSNWRRDHQVPAHVAAALGLPLLAARFAGRDLVLEGGAIDVNGSGSVLVTEECLLDQGRHARNPGFERHHVEAALRMHLGTSNVMWLGRGIEGDDTHGHIDDVCRFVNARTIVLCRAESSADSNYKLLEENRERLEGMRLEDGSKPAVVFLPMPEPMVFEGQRLPASYANFYIANTAVLVPTFNDPHDRAALGVLAELFPNRRVTGIHAVDLVWGLGTLHCLTQQQPMGAPAKL